MKPHEAFKHLVKDAQAELAKEVTIFYSELVVASPVDTGTFKSAWSLSRDSTWEWSIHNPMGYASILWDGRREVGNRTLGSEQWPQGGDPMLLASNRRLQNRLAGLKR